MFNRSDDVGNKMKLFKWLDRMQFLNLKIWDFSIQSLFREYGMAFMKYVVLRHPIKTLTGIYRYQKMNRRDSRHVPERWTAGDQSIVGVGFCLKPLDPVCLSGRANHDCYYFEQNLYAQNSDIPECCNHCPIKHIGLLTLSAGCNFYIMTSARDILFDLYLPGIERQRYTKGLFTLCRFSFEPFKIALSISGIEGYLFPFDTGDCTDYQSWLQADIGEKKERTVLGRDDCHSIEEILTNSTPKNITNNRFIKAGNIFTNND